MSKEGCRMCGSDIQTTSRKVFCSLECSNSWGRQVSKGLQRSKSIDIKDAADTVKCRGCSVLFKLIFGSKRRLYCGDNCRNKHYNKRIGSYKHRARAKKWGVEYVPFVINDVFVAASWQCQNCGCATPEENRGTCENTAPELDHVVPFSMGGGHTRDNVQCLCRACNIVKGNNV